MKIELDELLKLMSVFMAHTMVEAGFVSPSSPEQTYELLQTTLDLAGQFLVDLKADPQLQELVFDVQLDHAATAACAEPTSRKPSSLN